MYRLLIVDDELDIVKGLYNALYNYQGLELDVFKSYSAYEAMQILNTHRIDMVLSDISMPGMDGLEMISQVKKRWPYCQVIFLSGYTEFDYVYKAHRLEAVDYILKTEGYDKIIESLHKAVERIKNESKLNQIREYKLEFKHEFIASLLENPQINKDELKHILINMNITLDPYRPVFFMIGRFSNLTDKNLLEQTQVYPILNQLSCRYILPHYNLIIDEYEKNTYLFLMQPYGDSSGNDADRKYHLDHITEIKGLVELIQNRFSEESAFNFSIVLFNEPVCLAELAVCYKHIREILFNGGTVGVELIVAAPDMILSVDQKLESYSIGEVQAVSIVEDYIAEHLYEHLSLTFLANLVHYNASYLSRIFKKCTGVNLISYITDMRMEKAKEILTQTNEKINVIASELCFASPSYFNQTFKKSTGLSPLEYRSKYGKNTL